MEQDDDHCHLPSWVGNILWSTSAPGGVLSFQAQQWRFLSDLQSWRDFQNERIDRVLAGASSIQDDFRRRLSLLTAEAYFKAMLDYRALVARADPELRERGKAVGEALVAHFYDQTGLQWPRWQRPRPGPSRPESLGPIVSDAPPDTTVASSIAEGLKATSSSPNPPPAARPGPATLDIKIDPDGRAYMEAQGMRIYAPRLRAGDSRGGRLAYEEVQPWIDPVLSPFLEGMLGPVEGQMERLKWGLAGAGAVACGAGVVAGYVLGRWVGGGGVKGRGKGT